MINPALTGLGGACCCAVAIRGLVLLRGTSDVERRELGTALAEPVKRRGPTRQAISALGERFGPGLLSRMSESRRAKTVVRLDRAGRPGGMNLERYAEVRSAILVITLLLVLLMLAVGSIPVAVMLAFLGWIGLDFWLARTGRRRQTLLERDMPDFIDILSITVRSGASYRAALGRVASSLSGPPAEEIQATLQQMDLGATRREAFEGLRRRNESSTLDSFVGAQLQAEELGVPLADALAAIAADTRRASWQMTRRRAQRVVPTLTLITVFLILPATVLLIGVGLLVGSGVHVPRVG